jgi:hypothetical protein
MSDIKHPNRANAKKKKQGGGCKMCKPHKGKWAPRFDAREKQARKTLD